MLLSRTVSFYLILLCCGLVIASRFLRGSWQALAPQKPLASVENILFPNRMEKKAFAALYTQQRLLACGRDYSMSNFGRRAQGALVPCPNWDVTVIVCPSRFVTRLQR